MGKQPREFAQEEGDDMLPQNKRPCQQAVSRQVEGFPTVPQSGSSLNKEETKEEAALEKAPSEWDVSTILAEFESYLMGDDEESMEEKSKAPSEYWSYDGWSSMTTNCLLDAAIKLKKQKLDCDDWLQISHEVKTESGEARTVPECKVELHKLSQKYGSECALHNCPSNWEFFEKVETLLKIMSKETPEKCKWSEEATEALLKGYQRHLEERKKYNNVILSSADWNVIVDEVNACEKTGILKTKIQCRQKLKELKKFIDLSSSSGVDP